MYTREELGPKHFGPYPVQIADYNLSLKDGTLIAIRFWFPGSTLPFEANWDVYCQANNASESLEVISTKSISIYSPDGQPFRRPFPRLWNTYLTAKGLGPGNETTCDIHGWLLRDLSLSGTT